MAKYIVEIPDEKACFYVNDKSSFLRVPISVGENKHKSIYVPTFLRAIPYTEPDRKDIEDETWELAERIADMSYDDFISCFEGETEEYVYGLPYHEAKAKYDAWKKSKEKIHVGDEVKYGVASGVVVRIDIEDSGVNVVDRNGGTGYMGMAYVTKTGRHFPEVEELLKKLVGE